MTSKQKGLVVLGVLLLAEAFLGNAVSKTAKAVGVSGAWLSVGGLAAGAIVAAL
ncbi:hypothetical protein [Streptacidiphilus albus]|uniref:hypothetical protein n=1 Tax=Streptacidiphilus albus TaxID=105425 RepID=UPI000A7181F1|nr:hypothetical protein [Streptacidiphilus albus]